jgi:hypothetical protein
VPGKCPTWASSDVIVPLDRSCLGRFKGRFSLSHRLFLPCDLLFEKQPPLRRFGICKTAVLLVQLIDIRIRYRRAHRDRHIPERGGFSDNGKMAAVVTFDDVASGTCASFTSGGVDSRASCLFRRKDPKSPVPLPYSHTLFGFPLRDRRASLCITMVTRRCDFSSIVFSQRCAYTYSEWPTERIQRLSPSAGRAVRIAASIWHQQNARSLRKGPPQRVGTRRRKATREEEGEMKLSYKRFSFDSFCPTCQQSRPATIGKEWLKAALAKGLAFIVSGVNCNHNWAPSAKEIDDLKKSPLLVSEAK